MTQKELQKINRKAQFKMRNNMDFSDEFGILLEEAIKKGIFEQCKDYEFKTSISFVGPDNEKLEFFKNRLSRLYDSLKPALYDNDVKEIEDFSICFQDLSTVVCDLSNYTLADDNEKDLFYDGHDKMFDYGMEAVLNDIYENDELCKERAGEVYDYIYARIPYILEQAVIDNINYATNLCFILDSIFATLEIYYKKMFEKEKKSQ